MLTEKPSYLGERIGAGRIAHSHGLAGIHASSSLPYTNSTGLARVVSYNKGARTLKIRVFQRHPPCLSLARDAKTARNMALRTDEWTDNTPTCDRQPA